MHYCGACGLMLSTLTDNILTHYVNWIKLVKDERPGAAANARVALSPLQWPLRPADEVWLTGLGSRHLDVKALRRIVIRTDQSKERLPMWFENESGTRLYKVLMSELVRGFWQPVGAVENFKFDDRILWAEAGIESPHVRVLKVGEGGAGPALEGKGTNEADKEVEIARIQFETKRSPASWSINIAYPPPEQSDCVVGARADHGGIYYEVRAHCCPAIDPTKVFRKIAWVWPSCKGNLMWVKRILRDEGETGEPVERTALVDMYDRLLATVREGKKAERRTELRLYFEAEEKLVGELLASYVTLKCQQLRVRRYIQSLNATGAGGGGGGG
jgi:hypothetical protein